MLWLWTMRMRGAGRRNLADARTVREIIGVIEGDGWMHVRTRGSHRQYKHATKPGVVTVPGKLSRDLSPKLERSILKQAQILRVVRWNDA